MIDDFDIDRIDLGIFSGVFKSTTNSYKFLFFLALLNIAREKKDTAPLPIIDIAAGCCIGHGIRTLSTVWHSASGIR